jgi:Ca2+-binding RTX toxin-like protein
MSIINSTDTLTIKQYFNDPDILFPVNVFQFADGTVWDGDFVKNSFLGGTDGPDTIIGFNTSDTIQGLGGNDILYGRGGNDTLDGGLGNDSLLAV